MEENFKNKLGFIFFIIVVLSLAIGGYFFTKYTLNDNNKINNSKKQNYKIDKNKDYIYFINDEVISESAEIDYKDVVINLDTQTTLTESLEKENKIYKNSIKYIDQKELISNELIKYNNDNIYSLTFREYENYQYNNYVSLVINDFNYSCFDNTTFNKTKSYIFNTFTGEVLNEEEIFKMYNTNLDKIKEKIKTYLENKQTIDNDVKVIKIDDTINDFNNYSFYINDYGRLFITYLVKTTQVDYNEVMEVN